METVSSPCKTGHISGRPPPGLQKPAPPLKTKQVGLMGREGGPGRPHSTFPRPRVLAEPWDPARWRAHGGGFYPPRGVARPPPAFPGSPGAQEGGEGPLRECRGQPCGPHWRAPAVTCLDPAALQELDHVLGEARAQSRPEHAHVPGGPRAAGPRGIRGALSSRPHPTPGAPFWTGEECGRQRPRGEGGPFGSSGTQGQPAPATPPLPASRRQDPACGATCRPRRGRAGRAVGAETARAARSRAPSAEVDAPGGRVAARVRLRLLLGHAPRCSFRF